MNLPPGRMRRDAGACWRSVMELGLVLQQVWFCSILFFSEDTIVGGNICACGSQGRHLPNAPIIIIIIIIILVSRWGGVIYLTPPIIIIIGAIIGTPPGATGAAGMPRPAAGAGAIMPPNAAAAPGPPMIGAGAAAAPQSHPCSLEGGFKRAWSEDCCKGRPGAYGTPQPKGTPSASVSAALAPASQPADQQAAAG